MNRTAGKNSFRYRKRRKTSREALTGRNKMFGRAVYRGDISAVGEDVPYQRGSRSVTAGSCCFVLEFDEDSHHPKTLYDANDINKVHSAPLPTPFCFQQLSSLLHVFIMACIGVQLCS